MTARKQPQDRKPKATPDTEEPTEITVRVRERDWTISADVMDDMEFLEDVEALNSGNLTNLPGFCRRLLGPSQYEAAKDVVRDESGRVRPTALMGFIKDVLQADSSAAVPVGESSAS